MAEDNKNLQYISAPDKPANFDAELRAVCGVCPNNVDPYLRFVWGMDALEIWGNEEKVHRYPDSSEPPKYVGQPFWILEGWQSPEVYNRAEWELHKDFLGEFPTRGVWDFIEILRGDELEFVPLGPRALQKAREWKFWKSKGNKRAVAELLDRRAQRAILKEQRFIKKRDLILDDHLKQFSDAENNIKNAAFAGAPFRAPSAPPGFKTNESGLLIPNR